jgi:hypothetical protein
MLASSLSKVVGAARTVRGVWRHRSVKRSNTSPRGAINRSGNDSGSDGAGGCEHKNSQRVRLKNEAPAGIIERVAHSRHAPSGAWSHGKPPPMEPSPRSRQMEIVTHAGASRASRQRLRQIQQLRGGRFALEGSSLLSCGDGEAAESVSLIGGDTHDSYDQAEAAGIAWAGEHCPQLLHVSRSVATTPLPDPITLATLIPRYSGRYGRNVQISGRAWMASPEQETFRPAARQECRQPWYPIEVRGALSGVGDRYGKVPLQLNRTTDTPFRLEKEPH